MPTQPVEPSRAPSRVKRVSRWILRRLLLVATLIIILRAAGCMESLFYHPTAGPTPVPATFKGAELVTFPSRDGTRLCGWFIPAAPGSSAPANAAPSTILHVHGNAGNINDHIWFTEYLPAAGFNLFIFDYRGYGQSDGRARRRGPLIEDTHAALDYLLTRTDIDRSRIGMYGHSLGGSIGVNVMADRPEILAAVLESAFASWRDEAANAVGGQHPGFVARALAWICISDDHRPDTAIARAARRPILIVHGDADRIIPVSHGRKLKSAGGANVQLIEFPAGDHNTLRETHPELADHVITFFRKHLQNQPQ